MAGSPTSWSAVLMLTTASSESTVAITARSSSLRSYGSEGVDLRNWHEHYRTRRKKRLEALSKEYGDELDDVVARLARFAEAIAVLGPKGYAGVDVVSTRLSLVPISGGLTSGRPQRERSAPTALSGRNERTRPNRRRAEPDTPSRRRFSSGR